MILFPKLISTIGKEEMELASINLPHDLILKAQSENTYDESSHIYLMPHNINERYYTINDCLLCYKNQYTCYGNIKEIFKNQKTTIFLNIDMIPPKYKYIEVFKMNHKRGDILDFYIAERVVKINSSKTKILFGYTMKCPKGISNIHIGTLAKTDSKEWKFYPKMDVNKTQSEIVKQYLDEFQDY